MFRARHEPPTPLDGGHSRVSQTRLCTGAFLEPGWDSQVGEEAKLRGISNIGSQNGEHPLSGHDPGHPDWVGHGVPGAWFPHPFGLFPLSSEGQEVAMGTASLLGGGGVLTQFYPQAAKGEASPQAPVARRGEPCSVVGREIPGGQPARPCGWPQGPARLSRSGLS